MHGESNKENFIPDVSSESETDQFLENCLPYIMNLMMKIWFLFYNQDYKTRLIFKLMIIKIKMNLWLTMAHSKNKMILEVKLEDLPQYEYTNNLWIYFRNTFMNILVLCIFSMFCLELGNKVFFLSYKEFAFLK